MEEEIILAQALSDNKWCDHNIGDRYTMIDVGGREDPSVWKIAYYPLFGTYKGENELKKWVLFEEPRALVEKPITGGIDFREVPLRYLKKIIE